MDWRPVLGIEPEDAGTPVERACALAVLAQGIAVHEQASKRGEGW